MELSERASLVVRLAREESLRLDDARIGAELFMLPLTRSTDATAEPATPAEFEPRAGSDDTAA